MPFNPARPAVFLDRDGTLTEERSYITRPDQIKLLPGAGAAVRSLRQAGLACVVVTNQSAIGKGLITEADLAEIHEEMGRQLRAEGAELDGLYYCPVNPRGQDRTVSEHPERKPAPGLLLRAAGDLQLDLSASWMVGDMVSDVLAGQRAGCRGCLLVRTGHDVGAALAQLGSACPVVDDLPAAARYILLGRMKAEG